MTPDELDAAALGFVAERHIATLSTLRPDGTVHVVPVAFMYDHDERKVRVIAPASTMKVANVRRHGRATVSWVDGGRWGTMEGPAEVRVDDASVARTREDYTAKYGPPHGTTTDYVSIEIAVDRVMGRFSLPGGPR